MTFQLLPLKENYSPKIIQSEIFDIFFSFENKFSEFTGKSLLEINEPLKNNPEVQFFNTFSKKYSNEDYSLIDLCRYSNYFFNAKSEFRKADVVTKPDENNRCLIYPNKNYIEMQFIFLEKISKDISRNRLLNAILVYCGIIHIHPLEDGNGRSARIIFNLMTNYFYKNNFYIDIKNFSEKNWLYFRYSLNLLQIYGIWDYVLVFFVDMISSLIPKEKSIIEDLSEVKEKLGFNKIFRNNILI